jgi:16S rRNA U516 pseudouridylate synthase RsuA-like enzyme
MTLVEGRNRQIRKMMEALGLRVVRLHRVEFMGIGLTSTPSSRSSRKEENGNSRNSRVNNLAAAADDGELKRPGDWAYLDEREMNLIENAIQLARRKDENERRYI